MNPGGWRRIFSQLIFIHPFQFGPELDTSLGKVPWLVSFTRQIREFFPLDASPTDNFSTKTGRLKTSENVYFFQGGTEQSS